MPAPIVYDGVAGDASAEDQLFSGKKFWVAQRIPMRNHYLNQIKSNGGQVVPLEKNADYMIADHCRRDCPPGTVSYQFIEKSIEKGEIQDPDNHRAGPPLGTARDAGAISRPTKGGRAAYTAEEDSILYKWVADAQTKGGQISGNEIYKQLEANYPRHTWQSWRDRYLKQLRDRPAASLSVPDNAGHSPPSYRPSKQNPSEKPLASNTSSEQIDKEEKLSAIKVSDPGKARTKEDLSVEELAPLFNAEDWENVYAFVDTIESCSQETYLNAWVEYARCHGGQTAEQWRQYYEKIVRPQWQRDPVSKRERVKKLVEERSTKEGEQNEEKEEERINMDENGRQSQIITHSAKTAQSSKTADDEQEKRLSPAEKQLKRVRGDAEEEQQLQKQGESSRLTKRRKSASPLPSLINDAKQQRDPKSVEPEKSSSASPTPRASRHKTTAFDTQAILSSPSQVLPINAIPRPIASPQGTKKQKKSRERNVAGSSSPAEHPPSEASTTHSLQEFRRSLNESEELDASNRATNLLPLPLSSPAPLSPSSTSSESEDPDPPLDADELDVFFSEQHKEGFDDTFIARALKRTRLRPNLAIAVLDAWKEGKPLPNQRGIWSQEDDEDVEGGDGLALARLERKHTFDGWGGITERLMFLDAHRSRS